MTAASGSPRESTHGYSGTALARKLGIKDGFTVATVDAPDGFAMLLEPLPGDVDIAALEPVAPVAEPCADLAVAFFTRRHVIGERWQMLVSVVGPLGVIWVAWPKKASGVSTDITEDVFRAELLPTGWVDVKVCAIDATWSGLKFVLRKELRP